MNLRKLIVPVLAVTAIMSSCKSQYELLLASNDFQEKYEAAFKLFNEGKYSKAASMFESLSVLSGGTPQDDTVQYYWGLSNYRYKDYYTAETNFDKFIGNFPRSPFTVEASYLKIDCLYRQTLRYELDQTPTYTAITAISQYLQEYPQSAHFDECMKMLDDLGERLDRKAFEAARLYYHIEDYLASRVALRNVLKDDAENIYREDILYYTAMSSYKYAHLSVPQKQKERYLVFVDDYFNFIGELPDSPYRKELDALYRRTQKALGKYSGDLGKEMKEKDFAKERKAEAEAKAAEADKSEKTKK